MVQSDRIMQYGHLTQGLGDRRDSTLDSNGSTSFQPHQILNQALNAHHLSTTSYTGRPSEYRLSPGLTPSPIHQQQQAQQNSINGHQQPSSSSHYNLNTNHQASTSSPGLKRKPVDNNNNLSQAHAKRRREPVDDDSFDLESGGQGAKHWTDEEKTKLFNWLMGVGQDEHWQALRSAKNSCLRECANEVFGAKKSYQALKGCFERNFNLFKQIYAFETFHIQQQAVNILSWADSDRLKEYERRLQVARRGGCDVGNITARTIDHWHRIGWYSVFHHRWHGDPQTTKPTNHNGRGPHPNSDEVDVDDGHEVNIDFDGLPSTSPRIPGHTLSPPSNQTDGLSTSQDRPHSLTSFVNPQSLSHSPTVTTNGVSHQHPHPAHSSSAASSSTITNHQSRTSVPISTPISTISTPQISPSTSSTVATSASDNTPVTITLTQGMLETYLNFLRVQTQTGKLKLEYMRRREEREESESNQRREVERLKAEREAQQFEHNKQSAMTKQKTDKAIELLRDPHVDPSVKHSAGEYLKKLFET